MCAHVRVCTGVCAVQVGLWEEAGHCSRRIRWGEALSTEQGGSNFRQLRAASDRTPRGAEIATDFSQKFVGSRIQACACTCVCARVGACVCVCVSVRVCFPQGLRETGGSTSKAGSPQPASLGMAPGLGTCWAVQLDQAVSCWPKSGREP